jgi:hypothetical protein
VYRGPLLLACRLPQFKEKFNSDWHRRKKGARYKYQFTGRETRCLMITGHYCGMVDVALDGKIVERLDLYRPRAERGVLHWTHRFPDSGTHTVEFIITDQKNPESTNNVIDIVNWEPDGFEPELDPANLNAQLLPADNDSLVKLQVTDINGKEVILQDFDSVGNEGQYYRSWLKINHVVPAEFSLTNPLRSSRKLH